MCVHKCSSICMKATSHTSTSMESFTKMYVCMYVEMYVLVYITTYGCLDMHDNLPLHFWASPMQGLSCTSICLCTLNLAFFTVFFKELFSLFLYLTANVKWSQRNYSNLNIRVQSKNFSGLPIYFLVFVCACVWGLDGEWLPLIISLDLLLWRSIEVNRVHVSAFRSDYFL